MAGLEEAILLATQAHRGQQRRDGTAYILHPIRLMLAIAARLQADSASPEQIAAAMSAAVLHDVVEDTAYTLADLQAAGFTEEVITVVNHLTRRPDESYEAFIARIKPHPLARLIKLEDLRDNMNLLSLPALQPRDLERLQQYRAAWAVLTGEDIAGA